MREAQAKKQRDGGRVDAGARGAVAGSAHMDAMAELMEAIFLDGMFRHGFSRPLESDRGARAGSQLQRLRESDTRPGGRVACC